jgi:hypothetical protein
VPCRLKNKEARTKWPAPLPFCAAILKQQKEQTWKTAPDPNEPLTLASQPALAGVSAKSV